MAQGDKHKKDEGLDPKGPKGGRPATDTQDADTPASQPPPPPPPPGQSHDPRTDEGGDN